MYIAPASCQEKERGCMIDIQKENNQMEERQGK